MKLEQRQVQHLFWRAGFGATYRQVRANTGKTNKELTHNILQQSATFRPFSLQHPVTSIKNFREMSADEKKTIFKQNRENLRALNFQWITEMTDSEAFLREKMALFWHDHFACSSNNPNFMLSYLNNIRKHALDNFYRLLFTISKEPAMLHYLNNQQNRKSSPNENFAREVMELFTLGRGHYTEKDIKEAARTFTGWGFNREGKFVFRHRMHDEGEKEVFGRKGNFDGDDVLKMLLENKQTALHLTQKIYTFLVNEEPDEQLIERLADKFYSSGYDIKTLLTSIFSSEWFYQPSNIGVKIKSPVELLVGIQRAYHTRVTEVNAALYVQNILGQKLLFPPNVAGWSGGKDWIDSSTLIVRTRLTQLLLLSGMIALSPKDSGDDNELLRHSKQLKKLSSALNKEALIAEFDFKDTAKKIGCFLMQVPTDDHPRTPSDYNGLIQTIIHYSQLPGFQLC